MTHADQALSRINRALPHFATRTFFPAPPLVLFLSTSFTAWVVTVYCTGFINLLLALVCTTTSGPSFLLSFLPRFSVRGASLSFFSFSLSLPPPSLLLQAGAHSTQPAPVGVVRASMHNSPFLPWAVTGTGVRKKKEMEDTVRTTTWMFEDAAFTASINLVLWQITSKSLQLLPTTTTTVKSRYNESQYISVNLYL